MRVESYTMRHERESDEVVQVSVGYGADEAGSGVAYAAIHGRSAAPPLRVSFSVRRFRSLGGREVAYAALLAVAAPVRERVAGPVRFLIDDAELVTDLNERRPVPLALTMPYVALRCRLNRFRAAEVAQAATSEIGDLSARALAEVSLHVAA
jgi:hypothetical protein